MSRVKKLKPYQSKTKEIKFEATVGANKQYATKKARDEARNANRSLKKSARQQASKDIRKSLGY